MFVLLDSDNDEFVPGSIAPIRQKGGTVEQWEDKCSTEQRLALDLQWPTLADIVRNARDPAINDESAIQRINAALTAAGRPSIQDLALPSALDAEPVRRAIRAAAKAGKWFKTIDGGERLAVRIGPQLSVAQLGKKPLVKTLNSLRTWIDA